MSNATPRVIDAKVILNDESKMLDLLASKIDDSAKGYADDNFEFNNLRCWAEELKDYSEIDKKYAKMSDNDLKKALAEESSILDECSKTITGNSEVAQYWKNFLLKNKYYTEQTLLLVGSPRAAGP